MLSIVIPIYSFENDSSYAKFDLINFEKFRSHRCKKNLKVNNLATCNLCAQNAVIDNLNVKNIINGPSYSYGRAKFVDPVNGSDNNNGGIASPFQTITKALSVINNNSAANRYVIILFPGPTVEPAPLAWKPFVSLFGFGKEVCIINQDINYTASPQEVSVMDFININVLNAGVKFNLDASAATEVVIRIISSQCNCTWNGGGPLSLSKNNLLSFESDTQILNCTVIDGVVSAIAIGGFFGNLTINNGTTPEVQMVGGVLASSALVSLNGSAKLITRGVANTAIITGIAVNGVIPTWETDATSMTTNGVNTGPNLAIVELDEIIANQSSNLTITNENVVLVDAATSSITISLPPVASYIGRTITVKKIDASTNPVIIQAFANDLIDGNSAKVLNTQYQFTSIISNGISWSIVG